VTSILIAEDEQPQREALVSLLRELWPSARLAASCADGPSAQAAFEAERPDVAFLDVRLPGCSGIDVARSIAGRAQIVFVTAHDDYAVRAFEQGAVDYLLKPVQRARLTETIARLRDRARPAADFDQLLSRLSRELTPARSQLKWITASIADTIKLYPIDDVLAFQAQDKYTRVLTSSDDAIIRRSLRELLTALDPEAFWQIHRSAVVRASAIDCVKRDALGKPFLSLKGRPETFSVSSAFLARFRGM
jgi:DNA-binding LytR/AlgR family response regulator